ncbi:thiol:disulfide interchange protein DsbA/DsbL [Fulvimonas sp. R45]|uniref:thiol:disulfide interchange protein DsbA/DsbL n=1 Tax=Fulvimonas sp. R45 TaxID=3045937 RepID=UPI00265FAF4F|nr:thiol:disulfide interchange protein DsbA/DsbL [Fulvimonas sp. R45]MDO1529007.1 thiol:disulfide interchange protein DsbA/DsbL [Fulvimonas sp. R45]
MSKRFASLRTLALLGGLLLTGACGASNSGNAPAPYTDGKEYVTLPAAQQQRLGKEGKVEVVEVFSYGCIHCAQFAPDAEKLRKSLPAGVAFKLLPAPFSDEWLPYARAYYAADKLGVVPRTHLKLFVEKFAQHYPLNSLDDLADFYAREGVDRAEFLRIANSPQATAALKADLALIQKWGVDGTPTIVVNGKYRSNHIASYDQLVAMTQWLVQRELAAKGGR